MTHKFSNDLLPITNSGDGDNRYHDNDSKELYERNLKIESSDWEYRHKRITYKLNTNGYRTFEFNKIPWDKTVVMFGCSNMFGVGVCLKDTIPGTFSSITNIPSINLGVPGCSLQYMLYNSAMFRKKYPKPRAVVFDIPDASRCTLFIPQGHNEYQSVHCGNWAEDVSDLGKTWRRFDMNCIMHHRYLRASIQQMGDDIPYVDFSLFPSNQRIIPECKVIKTIDAARDKDHPGSKTNKIISEYIASELDL